MQFHLNGFKTGDPARMNAAHLGEGSATRTLPDAADVLIVGCGPAGLTLAAQLAVFPDIRTVIVDQKPGPLQLGQADGIACRTMEMFEAFGFAHQVLQEAYWVNETTFWKPSAAQPGCIERSGRVPDVEAGLSHMPHVILNQARVHDFYLEKMDKSATRLVPHYKLRLAALARDADESNSYPVVAQFEHIDDEGQTGNTSQKQTVRARYVVGCDGARSGVRQSMGLSLKGESANHVWGVMDMLVNTDFPDIRFKTLIQSATEGSLLIIPREGGYMVRIYVEMDKLAANERAASRNISLDALIAAAQRILAPYTLDVKEVPWWSVYEIGQRLCDRFDDAGPVDISASNPRIFIAGDACHTHSPKAGQGMNVSMQDAFNLGWKLAAVLQRRSPASLLRTYSDERQAVAQELIDFDRQWAAMLSDRAGNDPAAVQSYFVQHGRYTAGTATQYKADESAMCLIGSGTHQGLAANLLIGKRFQGAVVVRVADGRHMQLGACFMADGRWRLIAFAGLGDSGEAGSPIAMLCKFLMDSPDSPIKRFTPAGADADAVIDTRAVFQQSHHSLAVTAMPGLLFPPKGRFGLRDYEKVFGAACMKNLDEKQSQNPDLDIYTFRGIDRQHGCMVIVRPDQYVAHVLPLEDTAALTEFFNGVLIDAIN